VYAAVDVLRGKVRRARSLSEMIRVRRMAWVRDVSGGKRMRLWMLSGGKMRRARSLSEMIRGRRDGQAREKCPTRLQVMHRTGSRQLATWWSEARHRKHLPVKRLLKVARDALGAFPDAGMAAPLSRRGTVVGRFRRPDLAFSHIGESGSSGSSCRALTPGSTSRALTSAESPISHLESE